MQPILNNLLEDKVIHTSLMAQNGGQGKTDFNAPSHKHQSMILVDMRSPGIHVKRPLTVFGFDDAPHGHAEISFENVIVPAKNILLGEDRGSEITRALEDCTIICMRLIGAAERGMQLTTQRDLSRKTFGKFISHHGSFLSNLAKLRVELERTRLLVLEAADHLDKCGNKKARGILGQGCSSKHGVEGTRHGNVSPWSSWFILRHSLGSSVGNS